MTMTKIFIDQIDADKELVGFLDAYGVQAFALTPHVDVRYTDLIFNGVPTDGRVGALWVNGALAAYGLVVRDDLNRSVVTCHLAEEHHIMKEILRRAESPPRVIELQGPIYVAHTTN